MAKKNDQEPSADEVTPPATPVALPPMPSEAVPAMPMPMQRVSKSAFMSRFTPDPAKEAVKQAAASAGLQMADVLRRVASAKSAADKVIELATSEELQAVVAHEMNVTVDELKLVTSQMATLLTITSK
jgi:hypothetical protein